MSPIQYRGFYDVPLVFITSYQGATYLFDCPFDDEREDDSDFYNVYVIPAIRDEDLPRDWTTLHEFATRHLGKVPVSSVHFDSTQRREVDTDVIDTLLSHEKIVHV